MMYLGMLLPNNLNQTAILNKFIKWIKIKSKEDPDNYNEKVVAALIKSFDEGYCSGFSWMHRIRRQRGEEDLYFHQIEKIIHWNGSKRTLTPELDQFFNQFVNLAIIAQQDSATQASTSHSNGQNTAHGIKFEQGAAAIGRILAPSDEIYARTNYDRDYNNYDKAQTIQKLESLLEDAPNAMINISGECWSLRRDRTKHDYHAVDFGMIEINGEKKYWLYDPNHPKGTRYYENFNQVFRALQRAFFYINKQRSFPMNFQRYELLDLEQRQQEIQLETVRDRLHSTPKDKNKGKSKGKHRRAARSSHRQRTLVFGLHNNQKSQLSSSHFDKDKIAELTNIIQKSPTNSRLTLEIADEYQSIQIEKKENGYDLWLSEKDEKRVFNDLNDLFNEIKAYDKNFWQKMNIVTVFTQQLTSEAKKKASLEIELSIMDGDEQGVRTLVENGGYDGFMPMIKENVGHNLLTLAVSQKRPNLHIINFLIDFDKKYNLGLTNHVFEGSSSESGFDIMWFALTSGDINMIKLVKERFPEMTTCIPIQDGCCEGLSPIHVAIMYNKPANFIEALIENFPEMAKQKAENELFSSAEDLLAFSKMWGNTNPQTLAVLTKHKEENNQPSPSPSPKSLR